MNIGLSTLSLFMKSFDEMLETVVDNDFNLVELLAEGSRHPEILLENEEELGVFDSYDVDVYIHAPTVDLNLASINKGIRLESLRQTKQCIDLAHIINARVITIHPGSIGRRSQRLREYALDLLEDSVMELIDYEGTGCTRISVENMPGRWSYLCNRVNELEDMADSTGCNITIDTGHANTCSDSYRFYTLPNIIYHHVNDNDGKRDKHCPLGDGTMDLNLLNFVDNAVIELNDFNNVLKSRDVIRNFSDL